MYISYCLKEHPLSIELFSILLRNPPISVRIMSTHPTHFSRPVRIVVLNLVPLSVTNLDSEPFNQSLFLLLLKRVYSRRFRLQSVRWLRSQRNTAARRQSPRSLSSARLWSVRLFSDSFSQLPCILHGLNFTIIPHLLR